jgi:VanZ family protein
MSLQIFGFSSKTAEESSGTSEKIARQIIEIFDNVMEIDNIKKEEVFHTVHFLIRKCAHFAEFALLTLLVFFLAQCYGLKKTICAIISLVYCLIFASTDEIHQLYVDGRSGEVRDVFIDFCGGVFSNVCVFIGFKIKSCLFDKK